MPWVKNIFIDVMSFYEAMPPHCDMTLIGEALTHPIIKSHELKTKPLQWKRIFDKGGTCDEVMDLLLVSSLVFFFLCSIYEREGMSIHKALH